MSKLVAGQRWVSETEPELGLGVLVGLDNRMVCVRFDASECTRQYSLESAPLKRVQFKPGDEIQLKDNTRMTIEKRSESKGLLYYSGKNKIICEKDLADSISFSMPQDRLFAGITDSSKLFDLRYKLIKSKAGYDASPEKGFIGGQVELLPHQVFIADKVTSRYIPRVLLSDETGLGKTIEACLILHKLLVTHRAKRALIVVPESLAHQWFVELYRKFNLSFMLVNEEYCSDLEIQTPGINPFSEQQLGIVTLDLLANKKRQKQILKSGWDMVIIDEAHHITDDKKTYEFIKNLADMTFGLMLLTATPEQMGVKNHFLHLKLLDPERYFDFNTYLEETDQYKKIIKTVNQLKKNGENADHILDSYGPGRVIFRNKRNGIKGFPRRVANLKPLKADSSQITKINKEFIGSTSRQFYKFADDPRISYLVELMKEKKKILVICRSKEKVEAIVKAIANHTSIDVAKFDETMSLLQRDRNAAWFSRKNGAKILVCSEIGSEGRNFQFVHHLFLFDLPTNPELLEQRIGRVDRIGQKKQIQIHVPFVQESVHEIMARWYMDGLNLFEKNISGVHLIYKNFGKPLEDLFKTAASNKAIDESIFKELIARTKDFCSKVEKKLSQGKNILLEMNSFKPVPARKTIANITRTDHDKNLDELLIQVLDHYGIDVDFFEKTVFKLISTNLSDQEFPVEKNRTNAMTFNRNTAIARDDIDFFSWDHPFVTKTFEYFITNGTGACSTALLNNCDSPGVLLETIFILECIAPKDLNLERYLKADPVRIVVDHEVNDVTKKFHFKDLLKKLTKDQSQWFKEIEQVRLTLIPSMIDKSQTIAEKHSKNMIKNGRALVKEILGQEIIRLKELKKINPDIKNEEIKLAQTRMDSLLEHLSSASLRIDALRLIRVQ